MLAAFARFDTLDVATKEHKSMRTITILLTALFSATVFSQAPNAFNYQAVVRDVGGDIVVNTAVGVRFQLRQGSAAGTVVYAESHVPVTNENGVFSVPVGNGTPSLGTFPVIDWSVGPYFLEVGVDLDGGVSYTVIGTQQLLSVPFALHAGTVDMADDGDWVESGDALHSDGQRVAVGVAAPSPSAMLEVRSTTSGFLPPRMTRVQRDAITAPVAGLMVYCTDCGPMGQVQFHTGTAWKDLIGRAASGAFEVQVGAEIPAEGFVEFSANAVELSADGSRVAIGAYDNVANGIDAGHVRVFAWNGGTWGQLGADIDGETPNEEFGWSLSLSDDGSHLAVGAPASGANGPLSGRVRVFDLLGGTWVLRGAPLNGSAAGEGFGSSVSLSASGDRLAVGAYAASGNGLESGVTRCYKWDGSAWVQVGSDINGESAGDWSGISVAMAANGERLAIGALKNDGNGSEAGHVRVYELNGTSWVQLGADIDGEATGDQSGLAVSLSADGARVAIGAPFNDGNGTNSGHARVMEWNGSTWQQMGPDIDGEAMDDQSGFSLSLSPDGSRLAVGAYDNDGNGTSAGHVRVHAWTGAAWEQIGSDLDGRAANDLFGYSVSLSGNGSRLAAGSPNIPGLGSVRVFE